MNFEFIKGFAFLEFTLQKKKKEYGDTITGIYEITDMDKNNIEIRDDDLDIIIPKSRITKYEVREAPVKK